VIIGINGNGYVVSQERTANGFYGVVLDGVGNVNIHIQENYRVIVTTDANIQDFITTKVYGKKLHIDGKTHSSFNPTMLTIDVYVPDLRYIDLNGVGNIKVINGKTNHLELNLSGVGNIEAQDCEAEYVVVALSGTGDIKTWVTKSLTGKLSGIGNILYKGNPSINNVNRTGIGNIKRL